MMAGILQRLKNFLRPPPKKRDVVAELRERLLDAHQKSRGMQAKIDAAQTTDENRNHWAAADFLNADAAFNPQVRFTLRNRARYESLNNCYAKGDVRSSAHDLIGTAPRLQLTLPAAPDGTDNGEASKKIERSFATWAAETELAINLRTAEKSRVRDGECFGIFDTNERLRNPVKFDVRWVETDMCTTPFVTPLNPQIVDGIKFDRFGRPIEFYFLKYHPGAINAIALLPLEFYTVPSERVVHWYDRDRFGQHRAIPEVTPALPLYAQLRRWTASALTASEFAAMICGIMSSKLPLQASDQIDAVPRFDPIELVRGALLTLPEGYEATGFKAEQPTATYESFKREILNESGRATGKPLNVVSGNSSGYNYSSGRLDFVPYHRGIRIVRHDLRTMVLDPIFRAWYDEAVLAGEIPAEAGRIEDWRWSWNYDAFGSIDERKDAYADDQRIKNGTTNYSQIYSESGDDWQEMFEQIAREKAYATKLGMPYPILSMPIQEIEPNPVEPPADPSPPHDGGTPEDGGGDNLAAAQARRREDIKAGRAPKIRPHLSGGDQHISEIVHNLLQDAGLDEHESGELLDHLASAGEANGHARNGNGRGKR